MHNIWLRNSNSKSKSKNSLRKNPFCPPSPPSSYAPVPAYIMRTRNSTGWSVKTQSLAPDQSTMIIQRRISSKKKLHMDSKNSLLCAKNRLSLFVQRTTYGHFLYTEAHMLLDIQIKCSKINCWIELQIHFIAENIYRISLNNVQGH